MRGSAISSAAEPSMVTLAGFQHVTAVGDLQRPEGVLLDEEDGDVDAFMLSPPRRSALTRIGARPIDGSSSSRQLGRPISARAMASICCWPPERPPAGEVALLLQDREHREGVLSMSFCTRSSV